MRRRDRTRRLLEFQGKLASMRFLDPACGCGNFLIIAYRELRLLELEVLRELFVSGQITIEPERLSHLDVDQFYGIEIEEFPARIAEVALWMMDHIMNNRLTLEFGQIYARIPLKASPHIMPGDALEIEWSDLLAPEHCMFVLGNPPFSGSKHQSPEQREQVRRIAQLGGSGGTLDYVSAWFIKAGAYVRRNPKCRIGFVATNSITQGEQVAQLWPILFNRLTLEIDYAHRTFAWGSDARGTAHVHVVIVGLSHATNERPTKRLFTYDRVRGDPVESEHPSLTAYLFSAEKVQDRHLVVEERSKPLSDVPELLSGTQPIDDGNLIFTDEERDAFLSVEPAAAEYLHPYIGGQDWINGGRRWILYLRHASPHALRSMPEVIARLRRVAAFRAASKRGSTLAIKDMPTRFNVEVVPDRPFLALPEYGSERRPYVPIGWMEPPTIPSNLLRILISDDRWYFGILTSRMHMAWLNNIGGRMKSDPRYSIGIVYNTFPWPQASDASRARVRELAQAVLDARDAHRGATLAEVYDPETMPPDLRITHRALDASVDHLYRPSGFSNDRERVEHLFGLYEVLVARLPHNTARSKGSQRKRLRH